MPILWLVRQIRWFPYIAPSVVERLQATLSMPLNDRGISDYIFIDSECWLFLVKTIIFHWLRVDIGRVMITVLIWKMSCINLFITYFNIELKRTKLTSHTHTKLWVIDIGWGMITILIWKNACIVLFIKGLVIMLSEFCPMGWYRFGTSGVYVWAKLMLLLINMW